MRPVALISGVAGGIGTATAELFSRSGWAVVGVDRRAANAPATDQLLTGDLGDEAAARAVFAAVAERWTRIDALVNNAAVQVCKPLPETTAAEWDEVMACNVRSVFLAVRCAHPLLSGHDSAIVNVSSVHALASSRGIAAYAASKGAVLAMTRALAVELAPDRIRVNAVLPGAVDTPMLRAGLRRGPAAASGEDELIAGLAGRHPLGRVGSPEEIAEAILFLADHRRSSFMTGQTLVVDGGATARLSTE
jgi:NAD(P)-dependent dehydrogenase (short-subunit alcohol dehydrogenase family)